MNEAVIELAKQLVSNREIARRLHISRSKVATILKDFEKPSCACGRAGGHKGWCIERASGFVSQARTQKGRYRAKRLGCSGRGGVQAETIVIKAPAEKKQDENNQKNHKINDPKPVEEEKKSKPFSMACMKIKYPTKEMIDAQLTARHRSRL